MKSKIEKGKFEQVDTPPISEEGQIAQKLEEMGKKDPLFRKRLNNGEILKSETESLRQKLREELEVGRKKINEAYEAESNNKE